MKTEETIANILFCGFISLVYLAAFVIFQMPAFFMYKQYGYNWITITVAVFFTAMYVGMLWRFKVPPFNKN